MAEAKKYSRQQRLIDIRPRKVGPVRVHPLCTTRQLTTCACARVRVLEMQIAKHAIQQLVIALDRDGDVRSGVMQRHKDRAA